MNTFSSSAYNAALSHKPTRLSPRYNFIVEVMQRREWTVMASRLLDLDITTKYAVLAGGEAMKARLAEVREW